MTGTSNGGLTARPGGDRWRWESRLFEGKYDRGADVAGYRVEAAGIDPTYRSHVPVDLARRLGGEVTPARLAAAQRSGRHDPQAVKWLWHCLARFGRSAPTTA